MGFITIQTISKELMLACRQLGHVVPETLAALVSSTIVNPNAGEFYVDRPIDENVARIVVEEAATRILSSEKSGIATLRLQAEYENAFADIEVSARTQQIEADAAADKFTSKISQFTARFDCDFDTLTGLYKKIFHLLLLQCTAPQGCGKAPENQNIDREVAAALESVFPRVGLRSFVALTSSEKAAQLQELAGIVLGIRLFNHHQNKGGTGLPRLDLEVEKLNISQLLESVKQDADEVTALCKNFADAVIASKKSPESGPWEKPPSEEELDQNRALLMYYRQFLSYLLTLQEDISGSMERLSVDQTAFSEELVDLDALVGGRVSVPKEHVYPRFDSVARRYQTAWKEVYLLQARSKMYGVLRELRNQYFPELQEASREILTKVPRGSGILMLDYDDEEPIDLDAIPGPSSADGQNVAIRLTPANSPNFLELPLDFQGFCIHTLVGDSKLLVPGNPSIGVVKYAGRYCVFATERACSDFCSEPDRYFARVREMCQTRPELIHLLRVHEDFPRSSLVALLEQAPPGHATTQADVGTETPLHFVESNLDKDYEWNEWKLRKNALHMADIRRKATSNAQTALSHHRREMETQVYLSRDMATNTIASKGTNPPRFKKYHRFLRGEPQQMVVAEIKFDL